MVLLPHPYWEYALRAGLLMSLAKCLLAFTQHTLFHLLIGVEVCVCTQTGFFLELV